MNKLDTAHQTWNEIWATEAGKEAWSTADPEVVETGRSVLLRGGKKALDVGAGLGRHTLALARIGFEVAALDASQTGVEQISQTAGNEQLPVTAHVGKMDELPFDDGAFDYLVSYNVIYHGDGEIVRRTVKEFSRVLKQGGMLFLTMMSKRNAHYGVGEEIAPGTFVVPGASGDKIHPHFYCNAAELVGILDGFELLKLADIEQKPTHWHWHLTAVKA